jgi:acetolactate synthase I/II/III large subunit
MRLTDFIMKRLVEHDVSHVFMIPGGGAMHLDDSIGLCKEISFTCNHHEQACAIGAEGYARTAGKLGVVIVTSGPGGTNTLTGITGQWTDSVPVLYISGQIKYETSIESCREIGLRQLGDQEINIVDIVRPITKFAAFVNEPKEIKKLLDKAIYIATHGRPGPVWLDIPLNVQGVDIDENSLTEYDPIDDEIPYDKEELQHKISQAVELLNKSERPVFVAGHGIRIAGGQQLFLDTVEKLGIPVLSTFNGVDLIHTDHPLFIGRIGTLGSRAGNFALQNSDLLISVGSRNNIRQVSYNWESFARGAKKIIVDIDPAELRKPTLQPDLAIDTDAKLFLEEFKRKIWHIQFPNIKPWHGWCTERKMKYPTVLPEHKTPASPVNLYYFIQTLTEHLEKDDVVVAGNGSACVGLFQAGIVKQGQRMIWNSGCATMGYDLPAAIGACLANNKKRIVCLAGDGSMQMNIQELQTIVYHDLPIKIFYLNNNGYISMKQTQKSFFNGRVVASDPQSGVGFPDIIKVVQAYGFKTEIIDNHDTMQERIEKTLETPGPVLCEVKLLHEYIFAPKLSSERKPDGKLVSKPLEDLYPFLSRDEFKKNMIIPILED